VGTQFDPNGPAVAASGAPLPFTISDALGNLFGQVASWLPWLLLGGVIYLGWRYWHHRGGLSHVV
jgi:hypothetical protein